MFNFAKHIARGRSILDAARFDPTGRDQQMNASEADTCIRQQWYKKHSKARDLSNGFGWRGHTVERYVIDSLIAANVPLAFAGSAQARLVDPKTQIAATPDGALDYNNKDGVQVVEFKSIDPRTNKAKNLPRAKHVTQVQISMELMAQHVKVQDTGLLMYVDASNYDDILTYEVPRDIGILKKYAPRAKLLLNARKASSLDREGKTTLNECRDCDFATECLKAGQAKVKQSAAPSKGNRGSRLYGLVREYLDAHLQAETAKDTLDSVKEGLKQELVDRKVSAIDVGGVHVSLSPVKGRETLDKKAMIKAGLDLSPYTKIGKPSERLTVTEQ